MVLRFVHLSDIHFGQGSAVKRAIDTDVRKALLRDCQESAERFGKADSLLITGDIAYSGTKPEYVEAANWLDRLCEACGCLRANVQMVPGNHDVNWSHVDATARILRSNIRGSARPEEAHETLAEVCIGVEGFGECALTRPLLDYANFAEQYGTPPDSDAKPFWTKKLSLGHDVAARVYGLTTSLVSDNQDKKVPVPQWLGASQMTALGSSESEIAIALMHHPLKCFGDEALIAPYIRRRVTLLLTGHEHLPEIATCVDHATGHSRLEVTAGAVTPEEDGRGYVFTYNWLELSLIADKERQGLKVELWPRVWQAGAETFEADAIRLQGRESVVAELACPSLRLAEQGRTPLEGSPVVDDAAAPTDQDAMTWNEQEYGELRLLFWRAEWQERLRILVELKLFPAGTAGPLPQVMERRALDQVAQAGRLAELGRALHPSNPESPNPFVGQGEVKNGD